MYIPPIHHKRPHQKKQEKQSDTSQETETELPNLFFVYLQKLVALSKNIQTETSDRLLHIQLNEFLDIAYKLFTQYFFPIIRNFLANVDQNKPTKPEHTTVLAALKKVETLYIKFQSGNIPIHSDSFFVSSELCEELMSHIEKIDQCHHIIKPSYRTKKSRVKKSTPPSPGFTQMFPNVGIRFTDN